MSIDSGRGLQIINMQAPEKPAIVPLLKVVNPTVTFLDK